MLILDTNVISEFMQKSPERAVIKWLDSNPGALQWTTSITVYEIRFGIAIMVEGKKRRQRERDFERYLSEDIQDRVLPFDTAAAEKAAEISAHTRSIGRNIETRDLQIAAITKSRQATLATRNTKHFENTGVALVNPWEA